MPSADRKLTFTPTPDLPTLPETITTEAGRIMVDFFGDIPSSVDELRLDTQSVLTARPGEDARIKTLRKTIQEITGDGKLTPLPAQEEHILYEDSMYVCTHVFGRASGTKVTEAYLWAGATVSESAIQDAQIFARKVAKEAGAGQKYVNALLKICCSLLTFLQIYPALRCRSESRAARLP